MIANDDLVAKVMLLGMSEMKAKETIKNRNVTNNIISILDLYNGKNISESVGILLYHLATKIKPQINQFMSIMVDYIINKKLDSTLRVDAGLTFLLQRSLKTNDFNREDFEKHCGIGITVSPEEIDRTVEQQIAKYKIELLQQRYRFNQGKLMQEVRTLLPWADGKAIKNEVEIQIFDLLGVKTEEDLKPVYEVKKEANKSQVEKGSELKINDGAISIAELMKNKVHFHAPGDNYKTDGYVVTEHTMRLLKEHLKITNGCVRTRFPPEPNGILHIGHAKAININFGYAAAYGGTCYLRYDDTNPEKEEEQFFVGIKNMVEFLGYKPDKVTHSSDYFQQLYEWAIALIKKGVAYVCHQKSDELKGFNPVPSPWRDRPIEESLILFEDMKNGKIDEGVATLRMKITLEEGKVDPVAYRIKFVPHHRTGTYWCIYPTYDYTHCLCDSIEHITHSLCTKEFQSRRSSYYWLCNTLEIYCPVQWEYGRLNINYTVVSKRKIAKLITEKIVANWDDPRLFTLTALKRRGFPPEAINNFCAQIGLTGAQGALDPTMLEAAVRDVLNVTAPRVLVVLEPLKVTINNFPEKTPIEVEVPDFPNAITSTSHKILFGKTIYIEKSDFKESPEKGYRRLTKVQTVGLRHAGYVIKLEEIIRNGDDIIELVCSCESTNTAKKPTAFIQWVSNPYEIEVRLYERLFKHKNPEDTNEVPGGFLTDCNLDSLHVLKSYSDQSLKSAKAYDTFQFERIGFFSVDPDSISNSKLIFNRTVTLKDDPRKV